MTLQLFEVIMSVMHKDSCMGQIVVGADGWVVYRGKSYLEDNYFVYNYCKYIS